MDCMEILFAILNIIAIFLIPIVAVVVGQRLQENSAKRTDKMNAFKTLIASRIYGWTPESVHALNTIEIVFSDDKAVRARWKEYYELLKIQEPSNEQQTEINKASDELLKAIANSLGYDDSTTLDILQHPYMPIGLSGQMNAQRQFINSQQTALDMFIDMAHRQTSTPVQSASNQEDTSHAHS